MNLLRSALFGAEIILISNQIISNQTLTNKKRDLEDLDRFERFLAVGDSFSDSLKIFTRGY